MVKDRVAVLPLPSVTWTVNVYVPLVVGVPVIAPVTASSDSPGGSEPDVTAKVYAGLPPVTKTTCEYPTDWTASVNVWE